MHQDSDSHSSKGAEYLQTTRYTPEIVDPTKLAEAPLALDELILLIEHRL